MKHPWARRVKTLCLTGPACVTDARHEDLWRRSTHSYGHGCCPLLFAAILLSSLVFGTGVDVDDGYRHRVGDGWMMMMPCDDDPSLFSPSSHSCSVKKRGGGWRGTVHLCRKKRKGFGFQPSEGRRERERGGQSALGSACGVGTDGWRAQTGRLTPGDMSHRLGRYTSLKREESRDGDLFFPAGGTPERTRRSVDLLLHCNLQVGPGP